jgi:hypothetical protein
MGPGPMNTHTPCYSTIYSNGLQAAYVLNESCSLTGWMESWGEERSRRLSDGSLHAGLEVICWG